MREEIDWDNAAQLCREVELWGDETVKRGENGGQIDAHGDLHVVERCCQAEFHR